MTNAARLVDAELSRYESIEGRHVVVRSSTTTRSFSARQVPWAKIGTVIDDPDVDATEAARLGGLDFDVELRAAGYGDANQMWRAAPNRLAVVRRDTDELFSYVSRDYRVVQYREAFQFMDGINPRYVAAGTLKDGRQGFMVVQLPDVEFVDLRLNGEPDPHRLYVVVRTSHDLSKGIEVVALPLRNRCMNALGLRSFAANAPQRWSVRHVGDVASKLTEARRTLTNTQHYAERFAETAQRLVSVPVTSERLGQVLRRVLPDRPKRPEQVAAIQSAFRSSEHVGFTGTAWGAVNAVSEYFSWGRSDGQRTVESRFTGGLDNAEWKYPNRAMQLLLGAGQH